MGCGFWIWRKFSVIAICAKRSRFQETWLDCKDLQICRSVEHVGGNVYYDSRFEVHLSEENMALRRAITGTALAVAAILMGASVLALLQTSRTISTRGTVRGVNVGICQDSGCTQQLSSIDWGTLDNGTSTAKKVYIRNEGTTNMTLSMTDNTWIPSDAPNYLTLTWNREGYLLANRTSVDADLTLSVSSSFTNGTDFSFNLVITGTQQT